MYTNIVISSDESHKLSEVINSYLTDHKDQEFHSAVFGAGQIIILFKGKKSK